MSTVTEIQAALPHLSDKDLQKVDALLRQQLRLRRIGILYDDSYGIWTEDDQTSAAAEVLAMMEQTGPCRGQS